MAAEPSARSWFAERFLVNIRASRVVTQVLLLTAVAAILYPLSEIFLGAPFLAAESWEHPWPYSLIWPLMMSALVFSWVGSQSRFRWTLRIPCQIVLLLFSLGVDLLALEMFGESAYGLITGLSGEDFVLTIIGLLLVCLSVAGIRRALDLRIRYWIVLLALLVLIAFGWSYSMLDIFAGIGG
jgi:hypothetical protein